MTPNEKAKDLIVKFQNYTPEFEMPDAAKECALIAVGEVIQAVANYNLNEKIMNTSEVLKEIDFWQQVKEEINNA